MAADTGIADDGTTQLNLPSTAQQSTLSPTDHGDGSFTWDDVLRHLVGFQRTHKIAHAIGGRDALAPSDIGASPALKPTAIKTTSYTAAAGDFVPVDTTSGAVTVTLPTAPADGTRVAAKMVIQGGSNAVTIAAGGSDVFNKAAGSTSLTLSLVNQAISFQYKATGAIWYVVGDDLPLGDLDARYVSSVTAGDGTVTVAGTATAPTVKVASGGITTTQIADGTITDVDVAAANKDGVAGTASMRTLGAGAQQAAAGNDSRFPLAASQYMRVTSDFARGGAASGGGSGDTALANVAGMSFTIAVNEQWQFETVVFFDGSTTGDIKIAFTTPTGATILWGGLVPATGNGSSAGSAQFLSASGSGTALGGGAVGVGSKCILVLRGIVIADASHAGTVQMQMAQNTADGTNATTVYTNSHGRAVRAA